MHYRLMISDVDGAAVETEQMGVTRVPVPAARMSAYVLTGMCAVPVPVPIESSEN